jgi:hypothetical protein
VPFIFLSDSTHLTNFSGDKKMWPLYMTIRNLRTEVRSTVSHQAVVLLALLPSPIKMGILSAAEKRARQVRNREVFQGVLAHVLRPFFEAGGC